MAPTQGFTLSALPRAPRVPENIGVLDMKAIDEGVRRGLETFEMVRRAPRSMILADATADAGTAKQRSVLAQLPLEQRQLAAQTDAMERDLPMKSAVLAAEASPEMIEAKRQALVNRSMKQPSGELQMATAYANAQLRLAEDPTDAVAAKMVEVLGPVVANKSAGSFKNPQGVIDAGVQKTADTNQTRRDVTTQQIGSQQSIADANRQQSDINSQRQADTSLKVADVTSQGRVNAAKAAFTGKIYETAAEKNDKLNQDLAAVDLLDQKVDAYKKSFLGAGPIAGSGLATTIRAVFGDTTGKDLAAAGAIAMGGAIEKMRGLGAMSENEYKAAIAELPQPNDPAEVLDTKMDFIKSIRSWAAARNTLFLQRIEAGDSPIQAHKAVRLAIPLLLPNGTIADPEVNVSVPAPAPASAVAPAAPPATQDRFETGKEYTDAAGNKAIYRGNGQWEEIR